MNNQQPSKTKFIQFHFLTSYPASLINRDDVGFAKRIAFGNGTRVRISSQCLKRHWRTHEGIHSLKNLQVEPSIHSRKIFSDQIFEPLYQEFGVEKAHDATTWLKDIITGKSNKSKESDKKKNKDNESLTYEKAKIQTGFDQIIVLGKPEVNYLYKAGRDYCLAQKMGDNEMKVFEKNIKDNLKALGKSAAGLDSALFGRMVTADILARTDAAIHVAHAFTVHNERVEPDYFTAVDDLEKFGSAHINSSELSSSLFYGYVAIDLPLLVSNLTGTNREEWMTQDKTLAADVVKSLLHLVTTVSPGAKVGSTAPYSYSHFILAEAGDAQPCTFANAFLEAVKTDKNLVDESSKKLSDFIKRLDAMYNFDNQRCFATLTDSPELQGIDNSKQAKNLKELSDWIGAQIQGA